MVLASQLWAFWQDEDDEEEAEYDCEANMAHSRQANAETQTEDMSSSRGSSCGSVSKVDAETGTSGAFALFSNSFLPSVKKVNCLGSHMHVVLS